MVNLRLVWCEWRERRQIFQRIKKQQRAAGISAQFDVKDRLVLALEAIARGDQRLGAEMWETALRLHPREADDSPLKFRILFELGRFDEADSLMLAGRKAHPGNSDFVAGLIEIADARGDQVVLLQLCAEARASFPRLAIAYIRALWMLIGLNRLDEADAIAYKATKLFPFEIMVFEPFAVIAMKREDWEEALKRWQVTIDRFGTQHQVAYVGAAQVLSKLARFGEAEALLTPWLGRLGADISCRIELAQVAQGKGDTAVAIRRWRQLAVGSPLNLDVCVRAAGELVSLDDLVGAETILRDAVDRFPLVRQPLDALGVLLKKKENIQIWARLG